MDYDRLENRGGKIDGLVVPENADEPICAGTNEIGSRVIKPRTLEEKSSRANLFEKSPEGQLNWKELRPMLDRKIQQLPTNSLGQNAP